MPDEEIPLDQAIDTLADKFGVPRKLWRKVAHKESRGNINTPPSGKGARGLFQLMPATAANIRRPDGSRINIDDPLDNAYGGLKLLSENYRMFRKHARSQNHLWGMVLAGYHGNPQNVLRDLQRGGLGIPDQDDGHINTQDYVANILSGLNFDLDSPRSAANQAQIAAPSAIAGETPVAPTETEQQPLVIPAANARGRHAGDTQPIGEYVEPAQVTASFTPGSAALMAPGTKIQAPTNGKKPAVVNATLEATADNAPVEATFTPGKEYLAAVSPGEVPATRFHSVIAEATKQYHEEVRKAAKTRRQVVSSPEDITLRRAMQKPEKLSGDLDWHLRMTNEEWAKLSPSSKRKAVLLATEGAKADDEKRRLDPGVKIERSLKYQNEQRAKVPGLVQIFETPVAGALPNASPTPTATPQLTPEQAAATPTPYRFITGETVGEVLKPPARQEGPVTGFGDVHQYEADEANARIEREARIFDEETRRTEKGLPPVADRVAARMAGAPSSSAKPEPVKFTPEQNSALKKLGLNDRQIEFISQGGSLSKPSMTSHGEQVREALTRNIRPQVATELSDLPSNEAAKNATFSRNWMPANAQAQERVAQEAETNRQNQAAAAKHIEAETQTRVNAMMRDPNIVNMPLRAFQQKNLSNWWDEFRRGTFGDQARDIARVLPFVGQGVQLGEAARIYRLAGKVRDGTSTEDEKKEIAYFQVEATREGTPAFQIASIVAQLPAFATELALTGGTYTAGKKFAARGIESAVVKRVETGLLNRIERQAVRTVITDSLEIAGRTGKSLVGAAFQVPLARPGAIATGTLQRMTPQFQFEDGKLTGAITKEGKPLSSALAHSLVSEYIEVASEQAGGIFEALNETQSMAALKQGFKLFRAMPASAETSGIKELLKKARFHGTAGEMFEERVGDVAHYLNGDQDSPFAPVGQLGIEAVAFAIPDVFARILPGAGRVLRTVRHGIDAQSSKKHQDIVDAMRETRTAWARGTDEHGQPFDAFEQKILEQSWDALVEDYNAVKWNPKFQRPDAWLQTGLPADHPAAVERKKEAGAGDIADRPLSGIQDASTGPLAQSGTSESSIGEKPGPAELPGAGQKYEFEGQQVNALPLTPADVQLLQAEGDNPADFVRIAHPDHPNGHLIDKSMLKPVEAEPAKTETKETPAKVLQFEQPGSVPSKAIDDYIAGGGARSISKIQQHFHTGYSDSVHLQEEIDRRVKAVSAVVSSGAPLEAPVDQAAHEAAPSPLNDHPEPTIPQIEAGNYKKGHVRIAGMDISIENPQGSTRSGTDGNGKPWSIEMKSHYGYIRRTEGSDEEQVDAYIRPGLDPDYSGPIFVVNQTNGSKKFDEHKVMIGWEDEKAAREAYNANFTKGWDRIGSVARFDNPFEFKRWLKEGDLKQPVTADGQYSGQEASPSVREGEKPSPSVPAEFKVRPGYKALDDVATYRPRPLRGISSHPDIVKTRNFFKGRIGSELYERFDAARRELGRMPSMLLTDKSEHQSTINTMGDVTEHGRKWENIVLKEFGFGRAEYDSLVAKERGLAGEYSQAQLGFSSKSNEAVQAPNLMAEAARLADNPNHKLADGVASALASKGVITVENGQPRLTMYGRKFVDDFESEYRDYIDGQTADEESAEALVSLLESEEAGDLYEKVIGGTATDEESKEFRKVAKQYGVSDRDIDALEAEGIYNRQAAELVSDTAEGPESGQVAVEGKTTEEVPENVQQQSTGLEGASVRPQVDEWDHARAELGDDESVTAVEQMFEDERGRQLIESILAGDATAEEVKEFRLTATHFKVDPKDIQAIIEQSPVPLSRRGARASDKTAEPKLDVVGNNVRLLNQSAADLLSEGINAVWGGDQSLVGAFLTPSQAAALAGQLQEMPGGLALSRAIDEAAESDASGIVVVSARESETHERFHKDADAGQRSLKKRHARFDVLVKEPAFQKARQALIRLGYTNDNHSLVEEFAAFIAEGQYGLLGVTRAEGVNWLSRWFASFIQQNGRVSVERFTELTNEAEEARNLAYQTAAGSVAQQTTAEDLSGVSSARQERNRAELASRARASKEPGEPRTLDFYSQLFRTIRDRMPIRGSAEMVKGIISNPQSGVKTDEVKWSGFDDWITDQTGIISRDEALKFLRENQVKVSQVVKGPKFGGITLKQEIAISQAEKALSDARAAFEDSARAAQAGDRIATIGNTPGARGYTYSTGKVYEAGLRKDGRVTWKKVDEFGGTRAGRSDRFERELKEQAEYPWLDGVSNGDRISESQILKDPELARKVEEAEANLERVSKVTKGSATKFGPTDSRSQYHSLNLPGGKNYREIFITAPNVELKWKDGHDAYGSISNPIVRLRTDERVDADGKRLLFIQEMQPPQKSEQESMSDWAIKRWREIGIKSALRLAVDNGFDGIGWTTGEQQADRYNLRKHLDALRYYPKERGYSTGIVYGFRDGREVVKIARVTPENLGDHVGKGIAERLLTSPQIDAPDFDSDIFSGSGYHEIAGEELEIGGAGLKRVYDADLPSVAKKIGLKWQSRPHQSEINIPVFAKEGVGDLAQIGTENVTIHVLDIVPSMRDTLDLPLFRLGELLTPKQKLIAALYKARDKQYSAREARVDEPHHSHFQPRDEEGKFTNPEVPDDAATVAPAITDTEEPDGQRSLPKTLNAAQMPTGKDDVYEQQTFKTGEDVGRQVVKDKGIDGAIEYVLNGPLGIGWAPAGFAALGEMQSQERLLRESDPKAADALQTKIDKFAGDFSARATALGQAIVSVKIIERFAPDRAAYELNRAALSGRKREASQAEKDRMTQWALDLQKESDRLKRLEAAWVEKQKTKPKTARKPAFYQSKLNEQAQTILQTLKPKVGNLDLRELAVRVGRSRESGMARGPVPGVVVPGESIPPLPGDAELLAQYAASRLSDLNTIAELDEHLLTEFGQEINPFLSVIRQRAYQIRQNARQEEVLNRETTVERQRSILQDIQKEIQDSEREKKTWDTYVAKEKTKAERQAEIKSKQVEREWQALEKSKERDEAKATKRAALEARRSQVKEEREIARSVANAERVAFASELKRLNEEQRLEARKALKDARDRERAEVNRLKEESRKRLAQVRREYKDARKAENKSYREMLQEQAKAEREAGLWDTPLRVEAQAARERLQLATSPTDPQVAADLVSVAVERFLPDKRSAAVRTEAFEPTFFYVELKKEFPDLVTRKNQKKIYRQAWEKIQEVKAVAREAARLRSARKESSQLWSQGIDVDEQAILIRRAEHTKRIMDLRSKMAGEFKRVSQGPIARVLFGANGFFRAMMSSVDAPLGRQGMYFMLTHPVRTFQSALPATLRGYAAVKQPAMNALEDSIQAHPRYAQAKSLGLDLTEVGGGDKDPLLHAEEQFGSPLAMKFPHVRLSEQGYTAGMNVIRLDFFDVFATALEADGYTIEENREAFEEAVGLVNKATGRGNLPEFIKQATKFSNFLFFASRYGISNFQMLNDLFNPIKYVPAQFNPAHGRIPGLESHHPTLRKQQMYHLIRLGFMFGALYGLARLLGFNVEEFPIVRIGNSRIDLSGGKVSAVKSLMKLAQGVEAWGTGKPSKDLFMEAAHFGRGKLAPLPSGIVDTYYKKTVTGQPANFKIQAPVKMMQENILLNRIQPMIFGDFADAWADSGWTGLLKAAPGLAGVNVNTYPDSAFTLAQKVKTKHRAAVKEMESLRGEGFSGEINLPKQVKDESDESFAKRAQKETEEALLNIEDKMSESGYKSLSVEEKQDAIQKVIQRGRKEARSDLDFISPDKKVRTPGPRPPSPPVP